MSTTHDFGKMFIGGLLLERDAPRYSVAPTYEVSEPFRGSRAIVLRLFGHIGIVVGWWENNPDIVNARDFDELDAAVDKHLNRAMHATEGPEEYFTDADIVRRAVANAIKDPDTEWEILSTLGLTVDDV
jgi:hypothetical protein